MTATTAILWGLVKYGVPIDCVSDNGRQLRSEEFAHFLKLNGVKHVRVTQYHAASTGLGELIVQSFKNHMKATKDKKMSGHHCVPNFLPGCFACLDDQLTDLLYLGHR